MVTVARGAQDWLVQSQEHPLTTLAVAVVVVALIVLLRELAVLAAEEMEVNSTALHFLGLQIQAAAAAVPKSAVLAVAALS